MSDTIPQPVNVIHKYVIKSVRDATEQEMHLCPDNKVYIIDLFRTGMSNEEQIFEMNASSSLIEILNNLGNK
jgi:hypothetical protein